MKTKALPDHVKTYFWGDDPTDLDLENNQQYITQVILEKGDTKAIKWLFSTLGKGTIKDLLSEVKLSKKATTFWNIYFS